jgi:hypothetical protein
MANLKIRYVRLREQADGSVRPRSAHGPRERAIGFVDRDLRNADGSWFTRDQAAAFSKLHAAEIAAARTSGRKVKREPLIPRGRAVSDLWEAYTRSNEFLGNPELQIKGLAPASQRTYRAWMRPVGRELVWRAPVAALDPIILKQLHSRLLRQHGLGMANGGLAALGAALAWGRLNGWLPKINGQPVASPYKDLNLPSPPPRLRVGTDLELQALVAASDHVIVEDVALSAIGDAILTGFYTGQRLSDVLSFVELDEAPGRMQLRQSKTNARVSIPYAPSLAERFRRTRARRAGMKVEALTIIVNERTGQPYNANTFNYHYRLVRAAAIAGIIDEEATEVARLAGRNDPDPIWKVAPCPSLARSQDHEGNDGPSPFQFRDLRDSAVTWYARAGCTHLEIAAITGHTPGSILTILKHYLALDAHLADNAVRKLVDYMEQLGVTV